MTPPEWDLRELYRVPGESEGPGGVDGLVRAARARQKALARQVDAPGVVAGDLREWVAVMLLRGDIEDLIGRALALAELEWSTHVSSAGHVAMLSRARAAAKTAERTTEAVDARWRSLPRSSTDRLLSEPDLAFCAYRLARVRDGGRLNSPAQEDDTFDDWRDLAHLLDSRVRVIVDGSALPVESAATRLESPDRDVRRTVHLAMKRAFAPELEVRAHVLGAVVRRERRRAEVLFGEQAPLLSRQAEEEGVSVPAFESLGSAVDSRYEVARRWFRVKAAILGVPQLQEHDRLAPLGVPQTFSWDAARAAVVGGFDALDPELGATARSFFDEGWIDARPGPDRRGGGFCLFCVPTLHPYVFLSWFGSQHDLLTLAHELGHGLHGMLAREQGIHHFHASNSLAETVALAAEAVTLRHLLDQVSTPEEFDTMSWLRVDRAISSVFRLRAMWRFEDQVRARVSVDGQVSAETLGALWHEEHSSLYADTFSLSMEQSCGWSRVPHFVDAPGYLSTYVWGQLLALSLAGSDDIEGDANRLVSVMRFGGAGPQSQILEEVGIDVEDAATWRSALARLEGWVAQAESHVLGGAR